MKYKFNPERLAYWYLRLNGFLTIENFIVHDEGGRGQRTDVDLIAFRFPHRKEAFHSYGGEARWMRDDPCFDGKKLPFTAFVEVTSGECKLNGPWTDPAKENMPRAIRALGPFSTMKEVQIASRDIYASGGYASDTIELGLVSIGERPNPELRERMPRVLQITWRQVTNFIFDRFGAFERIKREHPQWDVDGHLLWEAYQEHRSDKERFSSSFVLIAARLNASDIERLRKSRQYER
jgi:hypothetical protein